MDSRPKVAPVDGAFWEPAGDASSSHAPDAIDLDDRGPATETADPTEAASPSVTPRVADGAPSEADGRADLQHYLASTDLQAWKLSNQFLVTVKLMLRIRHHHASAAAGPESAAQPLLFHLKDGPMRVSDLADSVYSEVSTVSRQVKTLAQLGLVQKIHGEGDRRVQMVRLTPSGAEAVRQAALLRTEWFAKVLSGWDPTEVETFRAYLEKFSQAVEKLHREEPFL